MPTTGPLQAVRFVTVAGQNVEQLVSVDEIALLIDHDEPVAVAVKGDAHIGAHAHGR